MSLFFLELLHMQKILMGFLLNKILLSVIWNRFQEFKDQGGAGDTLVKLGLFVPWSMG